MSCRQRTEYQRFTSSLNRQVEEFEVATDGGFWVAIGGRWRQVVFLASSCALIDNSALRRQPID
jgi:hypothetical protein